MRRWQDRRREAEMRLREWGEWVAKPIPGLSFPSMSVEGRIMEYGGAPTGNPARANIPPYRANPEAQYTHRIIQAAPLRLKIVAELHFAEHKSPQLITRQTGWTMTEYKRTLTELTKHLAKSLSIC